MRCLFAEVPLATRKPSPSASTAADSNWAASRALSQADSSRFGVTAGSGCSGSSYAP